MIRRIILSRTANKWNSANGFDEISDIFTNVGFFFDNRYVHAEIFNSDKSVTLTKRLHALMGYFYTRKEAV